MPEQEFFCVDERWEDVFPGLAAILGWRDIPRLVRISRLPVSKCMHGEIKPFSICASDILRSRSLPRWLSKACAYALMVGPLISCSWARLLSPSRCLASSQLAAWLAERFQERVVDFAVG